MAGKNKWKLTGSISLLISFVILLTSARCDDDKPFASQLLTFVLPITIQPDGSEIFVGDTLWIEADISDSLTEFNTNKKYSLPNFDFGQTSIGIRKLVNSSIGLSDQVSAASNFELIEEIGEVVFPGETFIDFKFKYEILDKKYSLRIGIIPKTQGIFCINFLSPSQLNYDGIIDLGKHRNGTTIIPVYEDLVFPINNGENNFELFKQNCLDQSEGPAENYRTNYRFVTFTFKVL